jgi:hypothetical protein
MDRLARASTVAHATGDKAAIIADGDAALEEFVTVYLTPSIGRRRALLDEHRARAGDEDELPRDVLTTLLRNQDRLDLPPTCWSARWPTSRGWVRTPPRTSWCTPCTTCSPGSRSIPPSDRR